MALAECAEPTRQDLRQKERIDIDPEAATDGRGRAGSDRSRILDRIEMGFHLSVESPSFIRQCNRTRGAV